MNQVRDRNTIQIENLFDRFYKDDLSRCDTQSSGLGLAIVKKIVELHGGVITAQLDDDRIIFNILFGISKCAPFL
jgi:signal transduction histidine kinase